MKKNNFCKFLIGGNREIENAQQSWAFHSCKDEIYATKRFNIF